MKKLLLIIPIALAAAFVWLGTLKQPASVTTTEKTIPSSQILGQ